MKLSDVVGAFQVEIQRCVSLSRGVLHLKLRVILDTFGTTNAGRSAHPFSNSDGYVRSGVALVSSNQQTSLHQACVTVNNKQTSYYCHPSALRLLQRMKKSMAYQRSLVFLDIK